MASARILMLLALCALLGSCELIADFDRGKLDAQDAGGIGSPGDEDAGIAD